MLLILIQLVNSTVLKLICDSYPQLYINSDDSFCNLPSTSLPRWLLNRSESISLPRLCLYMCSGKLVYSRGPLCWRTWWHQELLPWFPPLCLMDLRLASLTLGTLLILVTSGPWPSVGQKIYTNTWAVHITGGELEANRIARKHGFVNHGKVSLLFRQVILVCLESSLGLHVLCMHVSFKMKVVDCMRCLLSA